MIFGCTEFNNAYWCSNGKVIEFNMNMDYILIIFKSIDFYVPLVYQNSWKSITFE